ncbi:MAG: hypothetical protein JSW55_13100 [Chloroflexota bacterium]|nr:MAG: hypothetical protein JSW55_13100 [Chloroflexota bacterium]
MNRSEQAIISAISRGELLKSHREVDGSKMFRLHQADGRWQSVSAKDVRRLRTAGLIDSNKKFPVATFWLTEIGRSPVAAQNR